MLTISSTSIYRTIYGAMRTCGTYKGRLVALQTCEELDNLHKELVAQGMNDSFSIGHFAGLGTAPEAPMRRRSLPNTTDIDS